MTIKEGFPSRKPNLMSFSALLLLWVSPITKKEKGSPFSFKAMTFDFLFPIKWLEGRL